MSLSACLIVKNEERDLPRCLRSLEGAVDEVVVVDTGSTDRTVEIAKEFGAKVGYFEWCNDFAAARNASLDLATCDWLLQIDADEELWREDIHELRNLIGRKDIPNVDGAYILLRSLLDIPPAVQDGESLPDPREWRQTANHLQRLFRRKPHLRFTGAIHEAVLEIQATVLTNIAIYHYGYAADEGTMNRRFERNRQLTLDYIEREPDNPVPYFYAGGTCMNNGLLEEAEAHFHKVLNLWKPEHDDKQHFLLNTLMKLAQLVGKRGDYATMKGYAERALALDSEYLDPWMRLGEALFNLEYYWPAERALRRYLEIHDDLNADIKPLPYVLLLMNAKPQAHYILGRIAEEREDIEDAVHHYARSHELDPHHPTNPGEALQRLEKVTTNDLL